MKMEMELKILTLNCWDIPCISPNRQERIAAVVAELLSGSYDFAVFQEVWSEADYKLISRKTLDVLPYSHYFHSGVIGAGLCIFSKAPIVDVLFQSWLLNGYAHKIQHGDWFGGKGVGLCKVSYHGININIYTCHLHAAYSKHPDEYLPHRLCQAFELSQFIKATGASSDINIVAGDLNSEPNDLAYKLILCNANLLDCFLECKTNGIGDVGATNGHPRNSYTSNSDRKKCPEGQRIDYILYNFSQGTAVSCMSCSTPLDKCPNQVFSISDHEAVVATLHVSKSVDAAPLRISTLDRVDVLKKVDHVLDDYMRKLAWNRLYYFFISAALFCILISTVYVRGHFYGLQVIMEVFRIVLALILVFCILMGCIWNRIEYNGITNVQKVVSLLLKPFRQDDDKLELSPLLASEVF